MKHGYISAALLLALSAFMTLSADDYESGLDGQTIVPVNSKHIRMARERVEAHIDDWPEPSAHALVRVTAEFVLVNESKEPQSILVSFPGLYVSEEFRRWVDGEPLDVARYVAKDRKSHVYTSRISFAPKQTRTVRVKYLAESDATSGWAFDGKWTYVLKTGAHWKGKIDRIDVAVHFPMGLPLGGFGPFDFKAVKLSPDGYATEKRTARWVFENIEPDKNISVEWNGELAQAASDPLTKASKEEAPGLQLRLAKVYVKKTWTHKRAIEALLALRKAYPDSYEATFVDYHIARVHRNHEEQTGRLEGLGGNPKLAVQHYKKALKQELPADLHRDCIKQLFAVYSRDLKDSREAERFLSLYTKELVAAGESAKIDGLEFALLVSPEKALEILKALKISPDRWEWRLRNAADCFWRYEEKEALVLYGILRKSYPKEYTKWGLDYYVARCYGSQFVRNGKVVTSGLDDMDKAVEFYEKALKQELQYKAFRTHAIAQLCVYYLRKKRTTKADEMMALLKKDKLSFANYDQRSALSLIAAISPAHALELLKVMAIPPEHAEKADLIKRQINVQPEKMEELFLFEPFEDVVFRAEGESARILDALSTKVTSAKELVPYSLGSAGSEEGSREYRAQTSGGKVLWVNRMRERGSGLPVARLLFEVPEDGKYFLFLKADAWCCGGGIVFAIDGGTRDDGETSWGIGDWHWESLKSRRVRIDAYSGFSLPLPYELTAGAHRLDILCTTAACSGLFIDQFVVARRARLTHDVLHRKKSLNETLLDRAIRVGNAEAARILRDYGAEPTAKGRSGR